MDQIGHDDIGRRRRLLILGICSMSLLIVGLDTTIVYVALPSIHRELDASISGLQWVVDAYTLVLASLLTCSPARRPTGSAVGGPFRPVSSCSRSARCCAPWRQAFRF